MKFRVSKTSDSWYDAGKPAEGAYLDKREMEYDEHYHNEYAIEINSLEELMAFVENNGQIVISSACTANENLPELEIYDTYRE